jgi:hypothetical protein
MKTIRFFALALLSAFIISSCSSGLSFTKRRYTKGFYVHHRAGAPDVKQHKSMSDPIAQPAVVVNAEPVSADQANQVNAQKNPQIGSVTAKVPASKIKRSGHVSSQASPAVKHGLTEKAGLLTAPKIRTLSDSQLAKGPSGDGYSILWTVIVVLAILYLIGLLAGGFGLGGLIHLLAIVVVVLLILWLLKII